MAPSVNGVTVRSADGSDKSLGDYAGKVLLVLTDRHIAPGKLPAHAALVTGAVHPRLTEKGLRCDCNSLVETATAPIRAQPNQAIRNSGELSR